MCPSFSRGQFCSLWCFLGIAVLRVYENLLENVLILGRKSNSLTSNASDASQLKFFTPPLDGGTLQNNSQSPSSLVFKCVSQNTKQVWKIFYKVVITRDKQKWYLVYLKIVWRKLFEVAQ